MTTRMEMKEETEAGKRQVTTQNLPAGGGRWGAARTCFHLSAPGLCPFFPLNSLYPSQDLGSNNTWRGGGELAHLLPRIWGGCSTEGPLGRIPLPPTPSPGASF